MAEARRLSPLRQHWIGVVPPRLRSDAMSIEEVPFVGKVLLQCDGANRPALDALGRVLGYPLPRLPNTSVRKGALCLWLSPSSWLFATDDSDKDALIALIAGAVKDHDAAVTDLSDSRTTIRIGGARLADVLAKGCAFDLGAEAFEPRMVVRTLIADVPVILYREESDAYIDIYVNAYDADYLWTWLVEAAREFTAG